MRNIYQYILAIFACLMSFTSLAQTPLYGGPTSGVLTKAGSPYRIAGDILVPKDSTLTLEPGVVFNFDTAKIIRVDGAIRALGTEKDPILFTCPDSMTGWMGMFFLDNKGKDTSIFRHTKIEYVNYPRPLIESPIINEIQHASTGSTLVPMTVLALDAAPIIFEFCKFRRNWQTFRVKRTEEIRLYGCEYFENLLNFSNYSNGSLGDISETRLVMDSCYFYSNDNSGATIGNRTSEPGIISNCVFENNRMEMAFGNSSIPIVDCHWKKAQCIALRLAGGNSQLLENLIFEGSYGSSCVRGGDVRIHGSASNSIFRNCTFKNGRVWSSNVHMTSSPPVFENCVFENNYRALEYTNGFTDLILVNCIFKNNISSIYSTEDVTVINSVFANNYRYDAFHESVLTDTSFMGSSSSFNHRAGDLNIYNSIFWNNKNYFGDLVNLSATSSNTTINIYNSIFQNGTASVKNPNTGQVFTVTTENLYTSGPEFTDSTNGDFSFKLSCDGPPIGSNQGYQGKIQTDYLGKRYDDVFDAIKTDYAGNPRIYGDSVDIGAFEVQTPAHRIDVLSPPKDGQACLGENVLLTTKANSMGLLTNWEKWDGSSWNFVSNNADSLLLENVMLSDSGSKYRIKWVNGCAKTKLSDEVEVEVNTPVQVVLQDSAEIKLDSSLNLVLNHMFASATWSTGQQGNDITINGSDLGLGTHSISVSTLDANGCSSEDSMVLEVIKNGSILKLEGMTLKVYPNPSSGKLHIEAPESWMVHILDRTGRTIHNASVTKTNETDFNALPSGLYFLVLEGNSGKHSLIWVRE